MLELCVYCCAIPSIRKALADLTPYEFATMKYMKTSIAIAVGQIVIYKRYTHFETFVWKVDGFSFNV